jgi:hypothetical protein
MPPGGVRIAEPLALWAVLADAALTVGVGRKVGGIYRYVTSKIRVLGAKRLNARIQASL